MPTCKHSQYFYFGSIPVNLISFLSTIFPTEPLKFLMGSLISFETEATNYFIQFSSVAQSCPALCDPMSHSTPGLHVHHQIPEFTQTHIQRVSDAIQPSHPRSSPSPPAFSLSQHQGLFKSVSSLHQVAKVLEFQLQHQSFQ